MFAANSLKNNPANPRLILVRVRSPAGIDPRSRRADGAREERADERRAASTCGAYPAGSLYGQITGYYSFSSAAAASRPSQNDWLAGTSAQLIPQNSSTSCWAGRSAGATVMTTHRPEAPARRRQALGSLPGAVVAMNPRTGEVLAMVSNPSYDPNPLASHDAKSQRRAWKTLLHDPRQAADLTRGAGAVSAGFDVQARHGVGGAGERDDAGDALPQPADARPAADDQHAAELRRRALPGRGAQITLAQALRSRATSCSARSVCGSARRSWWPGRERTGSTGTIPFEIPFAEGSIPAAASFTDNQPLVAFSAIGQASVGANPLQMALVAAGHRQPRRRDGAAPGPRGPRPVGRVIVQRIAPRSTGSPSRRRRPRR